MEFSADGDYIISGADIDGKDQLFSLAVKKALANTYRHTMLENSLDSFTIYDDLNVASVVAVSDMIPVNKPNGDLTVTSADFMSVNCNNFKFMSLLKNYFNLTNSQNNEKITKFNNKIYTVLPEITKIKLNKNYTFVYKYCNNCYYYNNSIYTKPEILIPPSTVIIGKTC